MVNDSHSAQPPTLSYARAAANRDLRRALIAVLMLIGSAAAGELVPQLIFVPRYTMRGVIVIPSPVHPSQSAATRMTTLRSGPFLAEVVARLKTDPAWRGRENLTVKELDRGLMVGPQPFSPGIDLIYVEYMDKDPRAADAAVYAVIKTYVTTSGGEAHSGGLASSPRVTRLPRGAGVCGAAIGFGLGAAVIAACWRKSFKFSG